MKAAAAANKAGNKDANEKALKKKIKTAQKTVRLVQKTQVSLMAMAMRLFFIKSLKKFLKSGYIRSKYLYKFEIVDVISPKCYVILPKTRSVQSTSQTHEKFIFKQLHTSSVEIFCGTKTPTPQQVNAIIDPWINLVPKTPYIVNAYEVYRDYDLFMQMTEFCDGYDNVYNRLRKANFGLLQDTIPHKLIKMVYLFVIQISHAFAIAHSAKLTHGKFDLTQVIVDQQQQTFKITNFRPWLADGQKYRFLETTHTDLNQEQKLRIARSRDLFNFGCALYDFMLNKQSDTENQKQKVIFYEEREAAATGTGANATPIPITGENSQVEMSTEKTKQEMLEEKARLAKQIMPLMETIPLAWVQIIEGACIIDILNQCMIIDTKRDTVSLFNRINRQATEAYIRFFDPEFKQLPLISQISDEFMNYFAVAAINNRAVMSQFKIMSHQLGRNVSETDNQMMLDFQERLFAKCIDKDPLCLEANINMIFLLWRRGKLFDDQVCDEIHKRVDDSQTAQLLILAFRKANRYIIDPTWEAQVLKNEPNEVLGEQIRQYLKEYSEQMKGDAEVKDAWSKQKLVNAQTHISQLLPRTEPLSPSQPKSPSKEKPKLSANVLNSGKNESGVKADIKKIFFSKNERYIVMITTTHAIVHQVSVGKFELIGSVELPKTVNYKTADDKTLKELTKLNKSNKNIDALMNAEPLSPVDKQKQTFLEALEEQRLKAISRGSNIAGGESQLSVGSADDDAEAITDDGIHERRMKPSQKAIVDDNSEKAEERRQQRERECVGGGFFNSPWIAAIDNLGQTLCLHSSESVQLVPLKDYTDSCFTRQSGNPQLDELHFAESEQDQQSHHKQMQLVSELHVFSGRDLSSHSKLQIGHICPDEILDLELDLDVTDEDLGLSGHDSQSIIERGSFGSFNGLEVDDKDKQKFQIVKKATLRFKDVINDSPTFGKEGESESPETRRKAYTNAIASKLNSGELLTPMRQASGSPRPPNTTLPKAKRDRLDPADQFGGHYQINSAQTEQDRDNNLINIKEKRLHTGSATEINGDLQLGSVMLTEGGKNIVESRLPTQIFDEEDDALFRVSHAAKFGLNMRVNVKCKNLLSYDLLFAPDRTQVADDVPMVILQKKPVKLPCGAAIPTSLFRDPIPEKQIEKIKKRETNVDEATLRGFKALHFENIREWVQQQELFGNIVKFSLLDSKYCVGFQRSTYNGMKPHFFVYEILKRKVVRRFLPIIDQFKSEWIDSDPRDIFDSKKVKNSLASNDSEFEGSTASNDQEDFTEDVSVFEISPQGTYMVALVSGEFVTMKFLNRSLNPVFRKMLNPSFMIEEHVEMNIEEDDHGKDGINSNMGHSQMDLAEENRKALRYEKKDENLYVYTADRVSSQSSDHHVKNLAEQLAEAFTQYEDYVGSTYHKHVRLYRWHTILMMALKNPQALIYPKTGGAHQESTGSLFSQSQVSLGKENNNSNESAQIMPKLLRKVLQAIKEYNFSYSQITPQTQMLSGNIVVSNNFSKKTGVTAIKKIYMFDQFVFGRPDDRIKKFIFSTFSRNWFVAIYFRRQLQVYDQITGQQIFELVCPSARNIQFIDSENLLVVQEGLCQVFVCAINSQRQAFLNKELHVKRGQDLQVLEYEENQKFSAYTIGLSAQRSKHQRMAKISDESEESSQEDETIGIKVITFDETIKQMVTSRNVCPYGYLALIGETKLTIYLTYAEEEQCTYDSIWTINFSEMRRLSIGKRIEMIDFSPNCEEFVAVSNTGEVSIWSIKKAKFVRKVTTLKQHKQTPITQIRTFDNNSKCVMFSQPNNLIIILDIENLNERMVLRVDIDLRIRMIRPEAEGFGKLLAMQVDVSEQYLICTFSNNKVGIFSTTSGLIQLLSEDMSMICDTSFIDETGCFITMLDESKTRVNIYAIEWKFTVDQPPERTRKMSTIESLDAPSEQGEKVLPVERKLPTKKQSESEVKVGAKVLVRRPHHRSILPTGRRMIAERTHERGRSNSKEEHRQAVAAADATSKSPKSKACAIF